MDLVIGILIGCVVGVVFSLIPGFNLGVGLLSVPFIPLPTRFTVGLIIGIDLTNSIMNYLNYLHPDNREDIDKGVKEEENKERIVWEAASHYILTRSLFSAAICLMLFTQGSEILSIDNKTTLMFTLGGAMFLWFGLIQHSLYPVIAIISLLGFCSLTWVIKELPLQQPIIILFSSIYIENLISGIRYSTPKIKLEKKSKDYVPFREEWSVLIEGIIAGLLSSLLWGLPTSGLCKVFQNDEDNVLTKISRNSIADGVMSSVGLALFLNNGAGRSTTTSIAATLGEKFHYTEVIFILIIMIILSILTLNILQPFIITYTLIQNKAAWLHKVGRVLIIAILVWMSNGLFILTALIAFGLHKIRKISGAPFELGASSLSCIALISNLL